MVIFALFDAIHRPAPGLEVTFPFWNVMPLIATCAFESSDSGLVSMYMIWTIPPPSRMVELIPAPSMVRALFSVYGFIVYCAR
jgi:hypothetical protein